MLNYEKNRQPFCDLIRFWLCSTPLQRQRLLIFQHNIIECVCLRGDRIQEICFDQAKHGIVIEKLLQLLKIQDYYLSSRLLLLFIIIIITIFIYFSYKKDFLSHDNFPSSKISSGRIQDVLQDRKLLRWRRLQGMSRRRLPDVMETKTCLLGSWLFYKCF